MLTFLIGITERDTSKSTSYSQPITSRSDYSKGKSLWGPVQQHLYSWHAQAHVHMHTHTHTKSLNRCPLPPSLLFTQPPTPSHTHLLVQRQANLAHRLFASSRFIPSTPSSLKPPPTPFLAFLITSLFPHQTLKCPFEGHQRMLSSFQLKNFHFLLLLKM